MRPYDEQIKVWAAIRYNLVVQDISRVAMDTCFSEGDPCCGGADPGCYCSQATGASMDLTVMVYGQRGQVLRSEDIDMRIDDLPTIIQEIYEADFPMPEPQ